MGICVDWHNAERTILMFCFGETWTLDDYLQASQQTTDMMNSVMHPVAMITMCEGKKINLPSGFFRSLYDSQNIISPNFAGTAYIGNSAFTRSVYKLLSTVVPRIMSYVVVVNDMDEAMSVIDQMLIEAHAAREATETSTR